MKKLRGIIILIFVYLLAGESIVCAKELDFVTVDKETYRLYQEQKWDSLIDLGKEALKQNIDYYYLRYRLGVAYYSKQNFGKAIQHFQKAYDFNKDESSLLEYLYYANQMLNRKPKSSFYASKLSKRNTVNWEDYKDNILSYFYFEGGYSLSNDDERNGNIHKHLTDSTAFLNESLLGNTTHGTLGLGFNLSNRIRLFIGYNQLFYKKKNKYIYLTDLKLDSIREMQTVNLYYYSFENQLHQSENKVNQSDLYTNFRISLGNNWKIIPSFHYLYVTYTNERVEYEPEHTKAIEYYDKVTGQYNYFDYIKNHYYFSLTDTALNNYLAGIAVNYTYGNFEFGLGGLVSNLNFKKQKQVTFNITYYPSGNMNFYGSTDFSFFDQVDDNQGGNEQRILFRQKIGFKVFSKCWLEGSYMQGDLTNTSWNNAYLVYNVPDKMNYIAGLNILFPFNEKIELSLRYQYRSRSGNYSQYYIDDIGKIYNKTFDTDYQNQTIIGGIKWNL